MTPVEPFEKKVHPMMNVPDAVRIVLRETSRLLMTDGIDSETIYLDPLQKGGDSWWEQLLDRRLAQDVTMPEPGYPSYNASVMDGYAICTKDGFVPLSNETQSDRNVLTEAWTHVVVDKIFAGSEVSTSCVKDNASAETLRLPHAYYITTGAMVPENCDCVVPIEECWVSEGETKIAIKETAKIKAGTWIRPVGFDIPAGTLVLPTDHALDSAAIGLMLQSGVKSVKVRRNICVGVLSTGNELVRPGDDESAQILGKIPDVNRPILLSLLTTFNTCKPIDLGIQGDDDIRSLTQTIRSAIDRCHVIVTTGGISRGESDVMEQVFVQQLGASLHIGRFNMKPGKPTTFLTLKNTVGERRLAFCLPGNPVSGFVCAQLLVRPCLQLLADATTEQLCSQKSSHEDLFEQAIQRMVQSARVHPEMTAILSHNVKLDMERPEYHRVVLSFHGTKAIATSTGVQQSSRLMSLRDAEGLMLLPQGTSQRTEVQKGEEFLVLLLKETQSVTLKTSRHLNPTARSKSVQVAVIHVMDSSGSEDGCEDLKQVSTVVESALAGTKSGVADIVWSKSFMGEAAHLFDFCVAANGEDVTASVDLFVVVYRTTFLHHLRLATELRGQLTKVADSLALQARQGAASGNGQCALWETVIGYVPPGNGAIMIMVPEQGLQGALENVRGLLKHALAIARG